VGRRGREIEGECVVVLLCVCKGSRGLEKGW